VAEAQALQEARVQLHGRLPLRQKVRLAGEVLSSYVRARRALRSRPLDDVVRDLRAGEHERSPQRDPLVEQAEGLRVARIVQRTLGWLPADTRCLVRSLVVTRMLARRHIPAVLVIGVKPPPDFSAHAWVEHDGKALLPPGGDEFGRLLEL
jgi:hypothetical protein